MSLRRRIAILVADYVRDMDFASINRMAEEAQIAFDNAFKNTNSKLGDVDGKLWDNNGMPVIHVREIQVDDEGVYSDYPCYFTVDEYDICIPAYIDNPDDDWSQIGIFASYLYKITGDKVANITSYFHDEMVSLYNTANILEVRDISRSA